MIDYTWTVTTMESYSDVGELQDVVFSVTWMMTGEWLAEDSSLYSAYVTGFTKLNLPSNPDGSFTPYADLTELQVLGWVQNVLGDDVIVRYEQNIADQIAQQAGPQVIVLPLPWIPEPEPVPPEPTPDPSPPIPGPPVSGAPVSGD
jgi:hypothetical protein